MDNASTTTTTTRRELLTRAAYVTPAILTLAASPAFAQRGSFAPARPNGEKQWTPITGFNGGVPPGIRHAPGLNGEIPPGIQRAPGRQD